MRLLRITPVALALLAGLAGAGQAQMPPSIGMSPQQQQEPPPCIKEFIALREEAQKVEKIKVLSIAPLVAYAVFGPSRQLIVGPDAATMTVLAAVLAAMPGLAMTDRPGVAAMLALIVFASFSWMLSSTRAAEGPSAGSSAPVTVLPDRCQMKSRAL